MAPNADLYLNKIDLARYCEGETCDLCRVDSFGELLERFKSANVRTGMCPHWPPSRVARFKAAMDAGDTLPSIPSLDLPRPVEPGLHEINDPDESSPMLVTGNSEFTIEVMMAVLSTTGSPFRLLSVDTLGNTVDMAMIYKTLTAPKIASALKNTDIKTDNSRIILPGLAESLAKELETEISKNVETGPICAAELPLYMGDQWTPVG